MINLRFISIMFITLFATPLKAMVVLDDEDLSMVTGQAFFVSDYIPVNSIPNGGSLGGAADFSFYRMGLDVQLEMNVNMDKLQLGCGGYNESIVGNSCDIDMDFVRFMGLNQSKDGPGDPVSSDFSLIRPYIEIAIKDDELPGQREVVGIKIGAQKAEGFLSIGRTYAHGETNLEHAGEPACNFGSTASGAAARACHSGINRLSGNMNILLEGQVDGCFSLLGLGWPCYNGDGPVATFLTTQNVRGSRMDRAVMRFQVESFVDGLTLDTTVSEAFRFIHGMVIDTNDFFLSFQRESVAYPNYAKDDYSTPTNAGWWMDIPLVEMRGLYTDVGNQSAAALFGVNLTDVHLGQFPANNCYGTAAFC